MKKFFFLALFLISFSAKSQSIFKGKIVDNLSQPISYVTIKSENNNFYFSDAEGNFIIPQTITKESYVFSCVGYASKNLILTSETSNIIKLDKLTFELNEVVVSFNKKEKKIENLGNNNIGIGRLFPKIGYQYAVYIKNEDRKEGLIASVSYFIRKPPGGDASGPFRVRLYQLDPITKQPGKDLLNVNLIVNGNKDWTWFTVDLREYNIDFPENGFFVAMETLPVINYIKGTTKSNGYYENAYNLPGLGFNSNKKTGFSWVYSPSTKILPSRWDKWEIDTFLIKCEVVFSE